MCAGACIYWLKRCQIIALWFDQQAQAWACKKFSCFWITASQSIPGYHYCTVDELTTMSWTDHQSFKSIEYTVLTLYLRTQDFWSQYQYLLLAILSNSAGRSEAQARTTSVSIISCYNLCMLTSRPVFFPSNGTYILTQQIGSLTVCILAKDGSAHPITTYLALCTYHCHEKWSFQLKMCDDITRNLAHWLLVKQSCKREPTIQSTIQL